MSKYPWKTMLAVSALVGATTYAFAQTPSSGAVGTQGQMPGSGTMGLQILESDPKTDAQSPYAGMQTRSIKSLPDLQIADLKAGRGMGLALPAELNGYPGPMHVLQLAGQLGLSADQKTRVQSLFDSMKAEACRSARSCLSRKQAWITCSPATQSPPRALKP
jgi:hypothetical protein